MRYSIPLLLFLALAIFLWKGLHTDPHQLPSALINKPTPSFQYPSLSNPQKMLTQKQFLGHVSLLNIWATWCVTCKAEHAVLMDIARSKAVVVYGLNYKDNPADARAWLKKYGNPYAEIIQDEKGTLAIDFGAYGTPESFVIDAKGIIRYKYVGPITKEVWEQKIKPEVEKARQVE